MTPFNNNPESSRDFTILIRSSMSLFDIISVVFPDPNIFYVSLHLLLMHTLLANGIMKFFIRGNPVFNKGPRNLPKNPPDCIIFDNLVFKNLISTDELFENALRMLETCLSVSNNSCGKLFLSLE